MSLCMCLCAELVFPAWETWLELQRTVFRGYLRRAGTRENLLGGWEGDVHFSGRPLGALIFEHFADTIGRKRTTIISVMGFGVMTLLIAVLPGYQHWGAAAIWIFIALRLVDGIFLGGEYTSASPLAMEYCPKGKRGLYGAVVQSAASLGTAGISLVTLAAGLGRCSGRAQHGVYQRTFQDQCSRVRFRPGEQPRNHSAGILRLLSGGAFRRLL